MWTGDTTEVPALAGLQHALVQQGGGKNPDPGQQTRCGRRQRL